MKPDVLRGQVEPDVLLPLPRKRSAIEIIKANAGPIMFKAMLAAVTETERRIVLERGFIGQKPKTPRPDVGKSGGFLVRADTPPEDLAKLAAMVKR